MNIAEYVAVSSRPYSALWRVLSGIRTERVMTRGLAVALKAAERHGEDSELRLLRVPALNFKALWINSAGDVRDMLVPLRALGKLAAYQPVPLDEAFDALREAARPLAQMDDSMGA